MKITLPYPPSINHYWRHTKEGGHYISNEGKIYRQNVANVCYINNVQEMKGRLKMTIHIYQPDNRKRDIDNIQKPVLDALEESGVYKNDNQIDDLHTIRKNIDKHNPRIEIEITEMEEK